MSKKGSGRQGKAKTQNARLVAEKEAGGARKFWIHRKTDGREVDGLKKGMDAEVGQGGRRGRRKEVGMELLTKGAKRTGTRLNWLNRGGGPKGVRDTFFKGCRPVIEAVLGGG